MADPIIYVKSNDGNTWSDDGSAHRLSVGIDNRPANPASNPSTDLRVDKPSGIDSVGYGKANPNFFDGQSYAFEHYSQIGQTSGVVVWGSGVSNTIGNVVYYDVALNALGQQGPYPKQVNFNLNSTYTYIYNTNADPVNFVPQNLSVWVAKAGDNNLDGRVNINDLSTLAANWQATGKTWGDGDITYDGIVNLNDLSGLAANWNYGVTGGQSFSDALRQTGLGNVGIPEPSSGLLLIALGAVVAGRRFGRALGIGNGRKYDRAYEERAGRRERPVIRK